MIKTRISRSGAYIGVDFPCTEASLSAKLTLLGVPDANPHRILVKEVTEPTALKALEGKYVDLDELNFLAKRLDAFDKRELYQFYAVVTTKGFNTVKDIINLTYNLSCFTVVRDLGRMEAVGRNHYLNIHGCVTKKELEEQDMTKIGQELINSGTGVITEYGVMFENIGIPRYDVYDGTVFPPLEYNESFLVVSMECEGAYEYIYMPCEPLAIKKAVGRLGCGIRDVTLAIDDFCIDDKAWHRLLTDILNESGIYALNEVIKAIYDADTDLDKLRVVLRYADSRDYKDIATLARNLDCFVYAPDVEYEADVARYYLEHISDYSLDEELEDFFDFDRYGEFIVEHQDGEFIADGYVGILNGLQLEDILDHKKELHQEINL